MKGRVSLILFILSCFIIGWIWSASPEPPFVPIIILAFAWFGIGLMFLRSYSQTPKSDSIQPPIPIQEIPIIEISRPRRASAPSSGRILDRVDRNLPAYATTIDNPPPPYKKVHLPLIRD